LGAESLRVILGRYLVRTAAASASSSHAAAVR
jgi:hypothetical protein